VSKLPGKVFMLILNNSGKHILEEDFEGPSKYNKYLAKLPVSTHDITHCSAARSKGDFGH